MVIFLVEMKVPFLMFNLVVVEPMGRRVVACRRRVEAGAEAATRTRAESNTGLEGLDFKENKWD